MRHSLPPLALALLALAGAGCASHEDNVCEDIAECAYGGDTTFLQNCKNEAKSLRAELSNYGCEPQFDEYFACADSTFQCQGATAQFACSAGLNELNGCIHVYGRATACATLARQQAACTTPPAADGGAPPACTLARDCEASCILDNAADVCAPGLTELDAIRACTNACPPVE
jgi:hypothetical protein